MENDEIDNTTPIKVENLNEEDNSYMNELVYTDNKDNNQNVYQEENSQIYENQTQDENCEFETVILKNVAINDKDLTNAVVIGTYDNVNSDGNLQINTDENFIETFIVRNETESSVNEVEVEEYVLEQEDSNGNEIEEVEDEDEDEEGTIIEEYIGELDNNDNTQDYDDDTQHKTNILMLQNNELKKTISDDFPCNMCERTFKTAVGLKRHKSISHTNKDEEIEDDPLTLHICPCCGDPLDSNTHTVGDYQCTICNKLFPQQSILDRHTSLEHPEGNGYKCSECRYKSTDKSEFIKHLQNHSFKVVKCICNKEFTRKYHLERHLQISGCGGVKKNPLFKCEVCDKKFYRRDNLKVHLKLHQGKKEKNVYQCKYCKKTFQTMALVTVHERTHTGEKPFPCNVCPKKFPSSAALKKHLRMHTGEKPYKCSFCDNRFAAKETLNRHVKIHTGDKPHACQFCGKAFIQAAQLRAHIFHHTGENAYVCPYCSRAFNRKLRLTTHIKFMHEGAEPLHCKDCDKTFFRKEDLARHSVSHTGEKPFSCDVCEKAFAVKSSLKIHKLTHNKEPPCSCEYCGRAFIRQDCLMRHMRARHRSILEDIMITAEKKRLQEQLLGAISEAAEKGQKSIVDSVIWNEFTLTESIKELLTLLVDDDCLTELGYPDTPTDKVLDAVIKRCGHEPASEEDYDYIGRMRENAKLLFTVVIDDEAVKSLLNNQTVDEVILHVLRLARNP